jgi:uncharacterized membrane protein YccC
VQRQPSTTVDRARALVCLALYVAFWLELDNAYWAGTSAAIVFQSHLGPRCARAGHGGRRAVAVGVLTACFPQDRAALLASLALWGAACALMPCFCATLALSVDRATLVVIFAIAVTAGQIGQP